RLRRIFEGAGLGLTFFEFTVAMMFLYFAEAKVDVAVVETGLGGRLDSTNVVKPLLSVITPIGFDHVEYLGYTIPSIAAEKGGIIKEGVPVVIGSRDDEARNTLLAMASSRHSAARLIDRDFSFISHAPAHRLDYHGLGLELPGVEISLAGPFQHENAAIAIATLEAMRAQGWDRIDENSIRRGLRDTYWPGRFDIVSKKPLVIFDCAHNEMSIAALLETLSLELGPNVRPRLIFGCLSDKNWAKMAEMLRTRVSDVTLTRVKPKRPLDPENLAPLFAAHVPARIEREATRAIELVLSECGPDDVVLATGSVYFIGEVYGWLLGRQGRGGLFPEARV
ncbi:MAG TPA: Mur ligase family protein, partial [Candidatus Binataceae bacterium]|nr:Mur ligase family protein [Candidatus Binataceae bacterium]